MSVPTAMGVASAGGWTLTQQASVLFVDKAAELSNEDRKVLEGLGYTVIIVNGCPSHVLEVQKIIVKGS